MKKDGRTPEGTTAGNPTIHEACDCIALRRALAVRIEHGRHTGRTLRDIATLELGPMWLA